MASEDNLRVPLGLEQFLVIEVCLHTLSMFLPKQKQRMIQHIKYVSE